VFKKNYIKIIIFTTILFLLTTQAIFAIGAQSAIVIETNTGRLLYSKNIYQKMPMASTTKIMTALVALENGNLKDMVKIDPKAVGIEGSSIYLNHGEEISLEDLLYGLMLRSGNDAATAIAIHIGGSVEEFVEMMNKKAKEIGAINTNFTNPHGLHHKNHYTTAYDLALITRTAMLNKEFKKISGSQKWVSQREGNNYFYNKNKTLNEYEGGDGVKIGYTKAAGRCLVASATRNDMQLISVVLNDYNWFNDAYNLMDICFEKYKPYKVLTNNERIKAFVVNDGKKQKSYLAAKDDIILPLTDEEAKSIITIFQANEKVSAPISRGTILGKAKVYIKDKLFATTDLIATEDIEKLNWFDKIKNIFN